jgi:hypothetical protein
MKENLHRSLNLVLETTHTPIAVDVLGLGTGYGVLFYYLPYRFLTFNGDTAALLHSGVLFQPANHFCSALL